MIEKIKIAIVTVQLFLLIVEICAYLQGENKIGLLINIILILLMGIALAI